LRDAQSDGFSNILQDFLPSLFGNLLQGRLHRLATNHPCASTTQPDQRTSHRPFGHATSNCCG